MFPTYFFFFLLLCSIWKFTILWLAQQWKTIIVSFLYLDKQSIFTRNQICRYFSFMLSLLFCIPALSFTCSLFFPMHPYFSFCYLSITIYSSFPGHKEKKYPHKKVKVFTLGSISEKEVEKSRNQVEFPECLQGVWGHSFWIRTAEQRLFSTWLANVYMFGCRREGWPSKAYSLLTSVNGSFASGLQIPSWAPERLGSQLKCRFWSSMSVLGCKILDFSQAPRECQCYKFKGLDFVKESLDDVFPSVK